MGRPLTSWTLATDQPTSRSANQRDAVRLLGPVRLTWRLPARGRAVHLIRALPAVRDTERHDLRDNVVQLADHPDPLVREEVFSLLLSGWKDVGSRAVGLSALRNDSDFGVRTTVAIGLAAVSSEATIAEDTWVLRDVVWDRTDDADVRRAAYEALCLIYRRPIPQVNRRFDVEHDIDAAWLSTLGDLPLR